MSSAALPWTTPGKRLLWLPLAVLAALLAAREALGIEAGPLQLIAACFLAVLLLMVVARHPAAFIAPVLFMPRLREVGILSQFGPAAEWTALQVACGLLIFAIFLRWLTARSRNSFALWSHLKERPAVLTETDSSLHRPVSTFLIFATVIALSYLYTGAPHYGSEKLTEFATLGCGLFFAPLLLFTGERDFRDFTIGTALFGMLVTASSLSFSATGAMGAEDNPAHIGKGQVIGLAILLLVYTPVRNRWLRLSILLVCIPALAVGLVSAETRGPLFSLFFVLLLSFFRESFRSPLITRKQMAFVGVALVGAVMLLSTFWFYGAEAFRFQYKATEIVNLLEGDNQVRGTAVERLVFYRAAVDLWADHPVAGWGLGGWSMAYYQNDQRNYPHNLICEVLVEQGVVGLGALLLFLAVVYRHWRAHLQVVRTGLPCLLPGLVYLFMIAMFSGDLNDDRFLWFWCGLVLAGCALAARQAALAFQENAARAPEAAAFPDIGGPVEARE